MEEIARAIFDIESGDWDRTTESLRNHYRASIRKALGGTE
jgi:hypothetical protein